MNVDQTPAGFPRKKPDGPGEGSFSCHNADGLAENIDVGADVSAGFHKLTKTAVTRSNPTCPTNITLAIIVVT